MNRHLGLIIGVNHYQDSTFQPLRFAENDARALAQWLVNTKGGKWSPPDVQLVQGPHATHELIESLITQIFLHKAEEGDVVLFYFAGNAFVDEKTGEGYLALANSRYQNGTTNISLLTLTQNIFARSRASHILCIIDSFQAGKIWDMRRTSPFDSKPLLGKGAFSTLQQQDNRLFLCSCRGNSSHPEQGDKGIGHLIHSLIVGFSGPAINKETGNILLPTLHAYLFGALGEQQRPQLFGQQKTPFVLIGDLNGPQTGTLAPANQTGTQGIRPMGGQGSGLFKQPGPSGFAATGGLFKQAAPYTATAATELEQADPTTTGYILPSSSMEQEQDQRQQLSDILEQARQFIQVKNYGEAFDLVEEILQIDENEPQALILKGQLLGTAGQYQEALGVIDHLTQVDPNNPIGWSMQAVALSNLGQYPLAYTAIERSLELDPHNTESYAIKNSVMENIAVKQSQTAGKGSNKFTQGNQAPVKKGSWWVDLGLHVLGLALGIIGGGLLIVIHANTVITAMIGLAFISIGIAINCVTAFRGAYRNGFLRVLLSVLITVIAIGTLGAAYKVGYTKIMDQINLHPTLMVPIILLLGWLAIEAIFPLLLALIGFLGGIPARRKQRKG